MSYINKIKIGETTYDISAKCGSGIQIDDEGTLGVNIGRGLCFTNTEKLEIQIGTGLKFGEDERIEFCIGSGLMKQTDNNIGVNLGNGLYIDEENYSINPNLGSGLCIHNEAKTIDVQIGDGLKFDSNSGITCKLGTCLTIYNGNICLDERKLGKGLEIFTDYSGGAPVYQLQVKLGSGLYFDEDGQLSIGQPEQPL